MEPKEGNKSIYVEPKIIASYTKEELEETIKPHGNFVNGYTCNNNNFINGNSD
jgi:hypothetical protein